MIGDRVVAYFREAHGLPAEHELDRDASLVQSGLVDSLGMEELILFLEDEFGIEIADEDLLPDNFDSVTAIVSLVERKRGAS